MTLSALKNCIIHEDISLLVVNKPSNMLSVPGKVEGKVSIPRYLQWEISIKESANFVASLATLDCILALKKLSEYKNVPRKQKSFYGFIERTLKITSAEILESMWNAVVAVDNHLHKAPLDSIPLGFQSAIEILENTYGKLHQVHRLDCATSGVLIFTKTETSCAEICRQFRSREVR